MDDLYYFTVKEAAEALFRSEAGVRRLVKAGKLEALKEGGRYLLKIESLRAYVAKMPHPPQYTSAMFEARNFIGNIKSLKRDSRFGVWKQPLTIGSNPLYDYFDRQVIHYQALLDALKIKHYALADKAREDIWRERIDYEMFHRPIKEGEARKRPDKPEWIMDMLFDDEALN